MTQAAALFETKRFRTIKVLSESVTLFFRRPFTYALWTWAPLAAVWAFAEAEERLFGPEIDWTFGARNRPPEWFIGPQLFLSKAPPLLVILAIFLSAAVSLHIARRDLLGGAAPIRAAIQKGAIGFIPLAILTALAGGAVGMASMLYLIPGLALASSWAVAGPVCVFERRGPFKSLDRSYDLTKGSRLKILGLLMAFAIMLLGLFLLGVATEQFALTQGAPFLASQLVWLPVYLATAPFFCVGATVAYYDLRAVKEGVNIEGVATVFD